MFLLLYASKNIAETNPNTAIKKKITRKSTIDHRDSIPFGALEIASANVIYDAVVKDEVSSR